jgi:hypothetical protein
MPTPTPSNDGALALAPAAIRYEPSMEKLDQRAAQHRRCSGMSEQERFEGIDIPAGGWGGS